jgi:repressor LexA
MAGKLKSKEEVKVLERHLKELRKFYVDKKRLPTFREAAKILGFKSPRAVSYWVSTWIKKGFVKREATGRLSPGSRLLPIQILGEVQAGFPSPAEEEMPDTISLDDWLIKKKESTFMLKVSGWSMKEAGINPGDFVLLERGRTPKTGDIVVAEVDHEWTMKYFDKRGGRVILRPANKAFKAIVPEEELNIAGVVVSVIRKY